MNKQSGQHHNQTTSTMKTAVFILAVSIVVAAAAPADQIPIVRQEQEVLHDGTFKNSYETGNGIVVEEQGVLKNAGVPEKEAEEVKGSFGYTAPDGTPVQLQYTADENGFVASGSHLPVAPTPPPVPEAIARAIKWIEAHPAKI